MNSLSPSVLILAGGLSHERDVSLRSGRRVADALTARTNDGSDNVASRTPAPARMYAASLASRSRNDVTDSSV